MSQTSTATKPPTSDSITGESPSPSVAAGWYHDADGSGLRYWDGERWTEHRQAARPAAPARRIIPGDFWLLAAAVAAVVVGSLGPWATTVLISANGLDGDGWITLIMAAIGGASLYHAYGRDPIRGSWAPIVAGLIAAGVGIYDAVQIQDASTTRLFGETVQIAKVGWGLYLVIAAGVAMAIFGWRLRKE